MLKKWLIGTATACIVLSTSVIVLAGKPAQSDVHQQTVKIMMNGTEYVSDVLPQLIGDEIWFSIDGVNELFGKKVTYDVNTMTVHVDDQPEQSIAELEGERIAVYGTKNELGDYHQLTLKLGDTAVSVPGTNVANPTYAPLLYKQDLNKDGSEEVIIILTEGYGTGVYVSKAQVINADGSVAHVEDALTVFLKSLAANRTDQGMQLLVNNHQEMLISSADGVSLYDNPVVGSIITYGVDEEGLFATAPIEVAPGQYAGELQVRYEALNGLYQASKVTFTPLED